MEANFLNSTLFTVRLINITGVTMVMISTDTVNDFLNTEISWVCLVHSSYIEENLLNETFKKVR